MAQQALPKSASAPTVMKSNFNAMPVMQIYASSETMDESALATYLEDNVLPNFKRLQGVAAVEMSGVIQKTQQVLLTPFRSKKVFEKHVVQRVRSPHTGFDLAIRDGEILLLSLLILPLLRHALHLAPGFSSAAVTG